MRRAVVLLLLATAAACAHRGGAPSDDLTHRLGGMIWPLPIASGGVITSPYGPRAQRHHDGLDIDGRTGDPIHAAREGVVRHSGWMSGYGNTVIVDHGGGISTLYGHAAVLHVREGQRIARGQVIASVGATGNARGDHLHFEVAWRGFPIDPTPLLPRLGR